MRFAIIIGLAAGLAVGCASKHKHEASAPATPAATAEKAKTDVKAMAKDSAKESKKAVKEMAQAATATATSAGEKIECKLKNEARSLEVRAKDKGCEVAYTKAGQENVVGSSMNGTTHCEGIATRIKEKLVASGYTCN